MINPETHTRWRVQKLIRMGEWLERNVAFLISLYELIDTAHTEALEMELDDTLILEHLINRQLAPLRGMGSVMSGLRREYDRAWGIKLGTDVTLHHPNACADHQYEVVMAAPKPNTKKNK